MGNNYSILKRFSNFLDLIESPDAGNLLVLLEGVSKLSGEYFIRKFSKFLKGISRNKRDSLKIKHLMRNDDDTLSVCAYKVCKVIDAFEDEKMVDYFVNLTDSLLDNKIDLKMYFRVAHVLSNIYYEDLQHLSEVPVNNDGIDSKEWIPELVKNGLLISSGFDSERSVVGQRYILSALGYIADKYAVSKLNGERQKELMKYNDKPEAAPKLVVNPASASDDDICREVFRVLKAK